MSEVSKNTVPDPAEKWRLRLPQATAVNSPRRAEIFTGAVMTTAYVASVYLLAPSFKDRPYAILTHLLLLMGFAVILFGVWDHLALRALRRLLRRDRNALLETYAHPEELRRRLAEASFWQQASRQEQLGGGLVFAALRRYRALGRPAESTFVESMAEAAKSVRIGSPFLAYAIASAPLLGLLGTIVGLKATFENSELLQQGSMQLDKVMPYLGVALVTTLLGLAATLLGMLFVHLVNGALARDCRQLLTPVVAAVEASLRSLPEPPGATADAAAGSGSTLDQKLADHLFDPRFWSSELARHRRWSGVIALTATSVLIVLACLPGGLGDQLLSTGPLAPPEDPVPLVVSQPPETPPPPSEPQPQEQEFEISLRDLLQLYDQAVEPQQAKERIFAHLRYQQDGAAEEDQLGESRLARTYAPDHIPIGGFFDVVDPAARWKLDFRFPRLVARFDCLTRAGDLAEIPNVTYTILGGARAPRFETGDFLRFLEFMETNGYRSDLGQILTRAGIKQLAPAVVRGIDERAARSWKDSGEVTAGDQPVVLWLVYEPWAKLERAAGTFEDLLLRGRYGDVVLLSWAAVDSGMTPDVSLNSVAVVPPLEASRVLERETGG